MGRTGSTFLVGLLNSHPEIECQGEIISPHGRFSKADGLNRRQFLKQQAYETGKPIKGFKMPFDWVMGQAGVFEDLRHLGYRAIRLNRKNRLEWFISSKLAGANSDYSSQQEYKNQSIEVSPWEFLHFLGYVDCANKMLDNMINGFDTLPATYEVLSEPRTHEQLTAFLGVQPYPLTPQTVRSRTKPLNEVISNYEELAAFFRSTPYAHMWPTSF